MSMGFNVSCVVGGAVLLVCHTSLATSVTRIDALGGSGWTNVADAAGNGVLVGTTSVSGNQMHAYRHTNGVTEDLGTLGGTWSSAIAINDAGSIIVGDSFNAAYRWRAFAYLNGAMHDLGTLGGAEAMARGVNNAGVIVGSAVDAKDERQAFRYENGVMESIAQPDWTYSDAVAINNAGVIVGRYQDMSTWGAFRYANGSVQPIVAEGAAIDVNDNGAIAGWMQLAGGNGHAFRYTDGVLEDLGTTGGLSSEAHGINRDGIVVGFSDPDATSGYRAALWQRDGTPINLDAWLDMANPSQGALWTLENARDITDTGLVYGNGWYNDNGTMVERGYVIDVSALIPEPSGVTLLSLALIAFVPRPRRRP